MERPRFSKISTKSSSLLPTVSKTTASSTNDATTISTAAVNFETQSIRGGDSLSIHSGDTDTSLEINLSDIEEISNLPESVRRRAQQLNTNTQLSTDICYQDLYPNPDNINNKSYFEKCIAISKSNDSTQFHNKLKQVFIFSTAGKPIYSLNGSDELILGYMGILTTIISTFQEDLHQDLQIIDLGNKVKVVALNKAPIILIAISKLRHETDKLIVAQLQVLYTYLLSVLSKPIIDKNFHNRLNYDLRRILSPLDSENLDELCARLTYGVGSEGAFEFYMSTMLACRQSLKISHTLRHKMDKILKQSQDEDLVFTILTKGDVVINYLHPKQHNLPNEDLNLLIFIVTSLKKKEEDLWMPLCMPKFNKNGFLHVFVKTWEQLRIILISGNKNAFYRLRELAEDIIKSIAHAQSGKFLSKVLHELLVPLTSQVPFAVRHFLYVDTELHQFVTSELPEDNRDFSLQLILYYNTLRTSRSRIHFKEKGISYRKLSYMKWGRTTGFMLSDSSYEFYCITSDDDLDSKKLIELSLAIVYWCKKNRSRLFIT
ncbi:MON1 [Candida oxycetoniae]|uniref:Vacuolar fusion protein MON1 n=1 Tax=Candida oxycetoniae TaxID=497107 RepID=A0AAI9T0L1_9ASCO|nr:MON1 [Candida oxycetoniae]KAI3406001.2 MON1 [Candida oxycetoniae]